MCILLLLLNSLNCKLSWEIDNKKLHCACAVCSKCVISILDVECIESKPSKM